jgi:nucleoside-diphosphate-sugar epimerase
MKRRVPDISRAQELLGWRPSRNLDDIILEMADVSAAAAGHRELMLAVETA